VNNFLCSDAANEHVGTVCHTGGNKAFTYTEGKKYSGQSVLGQLLYMNLASFEDIHFSIVYFLKSKLLI
jgi:hypothetical protein